MLVDPGAHDEVAAGPTEGPGASLAGQAHLGAGVHAGRDDDRHGVDGASHATPVTTRARSGTSPTGGPARRTRREARDAEIERGAAHGGGELELDVDVDVVAVAPGAERLAGETGPEPIVHGPCLRVVQH